MASPTRSSLATRAALAVLLLVGFYVFALALAALLVWWPFSGLTAPMQLAVPSILGAAIILWSLVPRIDRFEPPGKLLTASEHPRLFAELAAVASRTGQAMPSEVYLVNDVNAFVAQRGGVMGFGGRRVMGIGLPLLHGLTVAELRAVVAHEFGHFDGGDTRLGPWIHKTRSAIGRTMTNLERGDHAILRKPFELYAGFFLRVTKGISREQELAADRLAAECAGSAPLASSLGKLTRLAPAFDVFVHSVCAPVLEAKLRPPLLSGFERFVLEPEVAAQLDRVEQAERRRASEPWDAHPPLGERIAALANVRRGPREDTARPAIELLEDPADAELAWLEFALPGHDVRAWPRIAWPDVCARVWVPRWRDVAARHAALLAELTFGDWVARAREIEPLAKKLDPSDAKRPRPAEVRAARELLECALASGLAREEWSLSNAPGAPVIARRDGDELRPFGLAERVATDIDEARRVDALLASHGLSTRTLLAPD